LEDNTDPGSFDARSTQNADLGQHHGIGGGQSAVDELAIATEHAPFRHRNAMKRVGVGQQTKKQKVEKEGIDEVCEKAT
jgi:hypothetical protein